VRECGKCRFCWGFLGFECCESYEFVRVLRSLRFLRVVNDGSLSGFSEL
jgi:hypothetical protein